MIKCENPCPLDKFDGCCVECEFKNTCERVCGLNPSDCGDSILDDISEETGLELFTQGQAVRIKRIVDIVSAKKILEKEEKQLKEQLKEAMEICNIEKFESNLLNITYVAETTTNNIDSKKLKKKYPEIAEECSRESKRSAYVKITMKGNE